MLTVFLYNSIRNYMENILVKLRGMHWLAEILWILSSINEHFTIFLFHFIFQINCLPKTINKVPFKNSWVNCFQTEKSKAESLYFSKYSSMFNSFRVNQHGRSQAFYHFKIFTWMYYANVNSISLVQLYIISLTFPFYSFWGQNKCSVLFTHHYLKLF